MLRPGKVVVAYADTPALAIKMGKGTCRSEAKGSGLGFNDQVYKPVLPGPGTKCSLFCAHAWASLSPGCGCQRAISRLWEVDQPLSEGVWNLGAEITVDVDIWD